MRQSDAQRVKVRKSALAEGLKAVAATLQLTEASRRVLLVLYYRAFLLAGGLCSGSFRRTRRSAADRPHTLQWSSYAY